MMYRLPSVAGEWIDRSRMLEFEFEGGARRGLAGDTISSALAAAGQMTLARSFKYHRPRGIHSFANHDANNLFMVDGVPNVRGDITPLTAAMRVSAVNTFGGVTRDRARLLEWLAPFLPVGFYYKAFHGSAFPRWERRIRALSGLGQIDAAAPATRTPKRYAFCDVLVIGAGPSGLAAAIAAADAGAQVLLADENARIGGAGAWSGSTETGGLLKRASAHDSIEILASTCAAGYYADHWVALAEPGRMTKVRARAVVMATGVIAQPAVFRNNDLPGVLSAGAARRLLHRHAIAPGKRIVVLTANREGYELARVLRAQSVRVDAVLDLRDDARGDATGLGDTHTLTDVVPVEALAGGDGALRALSVRSGTARETFPCDALIMSVGTAPASQLLLQAGGAMCFDVARAQHLPDKLPPGLFAAGSVNGVNDIAARIADGTNAGDVAAAHARGEVLSRTPRPSTGRAESHAYPIYPHPRSREFVDLDEDIQVKDLLNSVQEGYDSTELLKRFSTLGMGPSQGKHSNLNGARILMNARGLSLADTALTTQRPFFHPVPLKLLAGARFHVERRTAMHQCHVELGAEWMTLGGWRRPEYYARGQGSRVENIASEAQAVRAHAGLIDVSTLGKIEIFGPDAGAFLDRTYAGSFANLPVGMTRYGVLLDEAGIVRDDGVIARLGEEHFYFTTTSGGAANVYRDLLLWNARWRMRVAFVNATGHRAAMNLAGPASRDILRALVDIDVSETAFPQRAVREARLEGCAVRILRAGFVSSLGYEIHTRFGDGARVWKRLLEADRGLRAFGVEAQRLLRLERGHAIVAQDTDNLTDPFEAGLGFAVSMAKPFFIGQRSLRIHQQRGARQKLVGIELEPDQPQIREANLLIDGNELAGRVTSIARSPALDRIIGFAMVRPDLATIGTALTIRSSDGRLARSRVVKTPFVEAA
jgi:sarcosine oxidase, subunit alpha